MTTWFVTRHPGARDWVEAQGIAVDSVVEHLDPACLDRGDRVLGTLPVHLAAEVCRKGAEYHHLILDLPPALRGRELDAATMEAAGARLERFEVYPVPPFQSPGRLVTRQECREPGKGQRMRWRVLGPLLRYTRQHRVPSLFGLGILAGVLGAHALGGIDLTGITRDWAAWVDPLIGMATLGVASLVWFGELYQDWRAQLPCRLTVRFFFPEGRDQREVMRCERAHLSSPADMRQLGQQIGGQMADERNLAFDAPAIKTRGGGIERDKDGAPYRHYEIAFRLNRLPKTLTGLPPDRMILWTPPFESGGGETAKAG